RLLTALWPGPTVITVEDVHWVDDASAELLHLIVEVARQRPWLVCVTRREGTSRLPLPSDHTTVIHLRPLDVDAAVALVDRESGALPLPPHQVAALVERAGGNPLFLRELVAAVRQ